ncbi:MAG: hypothetical protein AAFP19_23785, partial [Bacteroidota bacterium]
VACFGECNGGIDLSPSCGTFPFTYDWDDDIFDGMEDIDNLCAGTYSVTVTDDVGVTAEATFTVNEPDDLQMVLQQTSEMTCSDICDAAIDVTVIGGTPPYSYAWSGGQSTPSLTSLCDANYILTVTDINGCAVVNQIIITAPERLFSQIVSVDAACQEDGRIEVSAEGGVPPYTYLWSNNATGPILENLSPGPYYLTVVDANGCVPFPIPDTVIVGGAFDLEVSSTTAGCGQSDGKATALVTGASNLNYAWSNGGTGPTQSNLAVGGYSVTVTDNATGCRRHTNVLVDLDPACFATISGHVVIDESGLCNGITGLEPVAFIQVNLDNGMSTFTDAEGFYEFAVDPGQYEISVNLNTPQYEGVCIDPITVNAANFSTDYTDNHFFLDYNLIRDLGLKVSKLNPRPGFTRNVRICVMNYGQLPMDGTLTFVHDPLQEYISTDLPPDSYDINSQTLTYTFTDHPPGSIRVYRVQMKTPANVPIGTQLDYYFKLEPISGDANPSDNEISCIRTVVGSYDPNDKQVEPTGIGPDGLITLADTALSYQIRFQNTGTDTAFTVVIRDTLDTDLDIRSLVPGPASHPYELSILPDRTLEFTFDHILLPDSNTNEPASHGFVFYDIEINNRALGTRVDNRAGIYFDYNAPIITNTVANTLYRPQNIEQIQIELCAGQEYNGVIYTESTVLNDTLAGTYEDSITVINILVNDTDSTTIALSLCLGSLYNGAVIQSDTTITTLYQSQFGCDSTVIATIAAIPENNTQLSISLCLGESYNGVMYTQDTSFSEVLSNFAGCDSTVMTSIQVFEPAQTSLQIELCAGELYEGQLIINDTIIDRFYETVDGCDSLVVADITVLETTITNLSISLCEGDSYEGQVINMDTTFAATFQSSAQCDSLVLTQITALAVDSIFEAVELCVGDKFFGTIITESTIFQRRLTNAAGCDSLIIYDITAFPEEVINLQEVYCFGETTLEAGIYTEVYDNIFGCDSTVITEVIVNEVYNT